MSDDISNMFWYLTRSNQCLGSLHRTYMSSDKTKLEGKTYFVFCSVESRKKHENLTSYHIKP